MGFVLFSVWGFGFFFAFFFVLCTHLLFKSVTLCPLEPMIVLGSLQHFRILILSKPTLWNPRLQLQKSFLSCEATYSSEWWHQGGKTSAVRSCLPWQNCLDCSTTENSSTYKLCKWISFPKDVGFKINIIHFELLQTFKKTWTNMNIHMFITNFNVVYNCEIEIEVRRMKTFGWICTCP